MSVYGILLVFDLPSVHTSPTVVNFEVHAFLHCNFQVGLVAMVDWATNLMKQKDMSPYFENLLVLVAFLIYSKPVGVTRPDRQKAR